MRKLLIIALSVMLYTGAQAQWYDWDKYGKPLERSYTDLVENNDLIKMSVKYDIDNANPYNVEQYIDVFNEYFFRSSRIKTDKGFTHLKTLHPNAYNVDIKFATFKDRTIAKAITPGDDVYTIQVDPDKWLKLNKYQRTWLVVHEYAHEGLNIPHGKGGRIMFPVIPELNDENAFDELMEGMWELKMYILDHTKTLSEQRGVETIFIDMNTEDRVDSKIVDTIIFYYN